jgi:hypothetical protein
MMTISKVATIAVLNFQMMLSSCAKRSRGHWLRPKPLLQLQKLRHLAA